MQRSCTISFYTVFYLSIKVYLILKNNRLDFWKFLFKNRLSQHGIEHESVLSVVLPETHFICVVPHIFHAVMVMRPYIFPLYQTPEVLNVVGVYSISPTELLRRVIDRYMIKAASRFPVKNVIPAIDSLMSFSILQAVLPIGNACLSLQLVSWNPLFVVDYQVNCVKPHPHAYMGLLEYRAGKRGKCIVTGLAMEDLRPFPIAVNPCFCSAVRTGKNTAVSYLTKVVDCGLFIRKLPVIHQKMSFSPSL